MRALPRSPSPSHFWPAFRPPAARPPSSRWWRYGPSKRQRRTIRPRRAQVASYAAGNTYHEGNPLSSEESFERRNLAPAQRADWASVRVVRPLQKSIHLREQATRPGLYVVVIPEILVRGSRDGLGAAFARRRDVCGALTRRNRRDREWSASHRVAAFETLRERRRPRARQARREELT